MKKVIGNILLIIFSTLWLYGASAKLELKTPAIYKGQGAQFAISASGSNIEFPTISDIEGFSVHQNGTSTSYININGKTTQTITKNYIFTPSKTVTIPSFNIKIDGQNFTTLSQKVTILKPQASKNGAPFIVDMNISKTHLKVGESATLKIKFKQRFDAKADRVTLSEPKIDNFWIKKTTTPKHYQEGNYMVNEYDYLIFAQKEGKFHIDPIVANIGKAIQTHSNDPFFNDPIFNAFNTQIRWSKIASNSLDVSVDPLPQNLELFGDFTISATVDKHTVYANKPINLTIHVSGKGNIDDVQKFDINIPNAVVYADKPKIKSGIINGKYGGDFFQKIAIVSDSNYTIPAISLRFFDKTNNNVKTISTKPIQISVIGSSSKGTLQEPKIETATGVKSLSQNTPKVITKIVKKEQNPFTKWLFMLFGLILGVALTLAWLKLKKPNQKRENGIIKEIKKAKDDRALFELLLPYANESKVVANALKELEENLYRGKNNRIDKQKLYDYFFDLEEHRENKY